MHSSSPDPFSGRTQITGRRGGATQSRWPITVWVVCNLGCKQQCASFIGRKCNGEEAELDWWNPMFERNTRNKFLSIPLNLSLSFFLKNDLSHETHNQPAIESVDMADHLGLQTSYYTRDQMKVIQSLEAHHLFECGWVYDWERNSKGTTVVQFRQAKAPCANPPYWAVCGLNPIWLRLCQPRKTISTKRSTVHEYSLNIVHVC